MRFSSIFQLPLPQRHAAVEPAPAPAEDASAAAIAPKALEPALPDALDERVRMLGEWQIGEG